MYRKDPIMFRFVWFPVIASRFYCFVDILISLKFLIFFPELLAQAQISRLCENGRQNLYAWRRKGCDLLSELVVFFS